MSNLLTWHHHVVIRDYQIIRLLRDYRGVDSKYSGPSIIRTLDYPVFVSTVSSKVKFKMRMRINIFVLFQCSCTFVMATTATAVSKTKRKRVVLSIENKLKIIDQCVSYNCYW